MTQAKRGDTVKIHYTGRLEDTTTFETSTEHDPLQFTLGEGKMIPGFEKAVIGMKPGESKTVKVPADKAYGPYRKDLIIEVGREKIPPNLKAVVGHPLRIRLADGKTTMVKVIELSESTITLDGNHPLAGEDLTFDIQLLEIS
jgi:FKBP-type peptidyl-prolyl cis-trans isomerase 2